MANTQHNIYIDYSTPADAVCVETFLEALMPYSSNGPQEIHEFQIQSYQLNLGVTVVMNRTMYQMYSVSANDAAIAALIVNLAACLTGGGNAPYQMKNINFT